MEVLPAAPQFGGVSSFQDCNLGNGKAQFWSPAEGAARRKNPALRFAPQTLSGQVTSAEEGPME